MPKYTCVGKNIVGVGTGCYAPAARGKISEKSVKNQRKIQVRKSWRKWKKIERRRRVRRKKPATVGGWEKEKSQKKGWKSAASQKKEKRNMWKEKKEIIKRQKRNLESLAGLLKYSGRQGCLDPLLYYYGKSVYGRHRERKLALQGVYGPSRSTLLSSDAGVDRQ